MPKADGGRVITQAYSGYMSDFIVSVRQRLDAFLSSQEGAASRSSVQRLIRDGQVTVNGKIVKKPAYGVKAGDTISVVAASRSSAELTAGGSQLQSVQTEPADLHLEILYEDDACLVINKPAGIAVHPAASMREGERTILNGIAYLFDQRRANGASLRFTSDAVLVHRLDKETTGCLLIAKTPEAHAALQKQFEKRTVQKKYLALVAGIPDSPSAVIDAPVGRNLLHRMKMSILRTSKSREAKTTYRTVDASHDCALLECELHTGRTHQIRVHLNSIGHPILGDPKYGSNASKNISKLYNIENLCLHAWKLSFVSPVTSVRKTVVASLSQHFEKLLCEINLRPPNG